MACRLRRLQELFSRSYIDAAAERSSHDSGRRPAIRPGRAPAEQILDKIVNTSALSVVSALDNRVSKLDGQGALVVERIANLRASGEELC